MKSLVRKTNLKYFSTKIKKWFLQGKFLTYILLQLPLYKQVTVRIANIPSRVCTLQNFWHNTPFLP